MRNYEHCIECEERTGRAGASDDSLYHGYSGPFCEDCFDAWPDNQVSQIILLRQELKQAQARVAEPVAFAVYWSQGDVELYEAPLPAFGGDPEAVTPLYTRPPSAGVPVGEIVTKPFVDVKFFENTEFGTALPEGTKLYTHPQPAHQGSVTEETVENWRHDSEEMEALHANFDDAGTPRAAQGGEVYSAWGRALRFAEQQGSVPDVGAMADVLGEWVRNTTGTALTHVTLVDMVRVMLTAAPTPEAGQDVGPVSFGNGDKVVEVGLYAGKPAVFVAPAEPSGDPGELAPPTTGEDKHRLVPGEWLMTFPTEEQAYEVADALCGRPLKKLYESHSQPAQQGSVPENWKLVPIVPTKSMQDAWDTAPTNECADQEFIDAYQAMLDVAPQPPQEQDDE